MRWHQRIKHMQTEKNRRSNPRGRLGRHQTAIWVLSNGTPPEHESVHARSARLRCTEQSRSETRRPLRRIRVFDMSVEDAAQDVGRLATDNAGPGNRVHSRRHQDQRTARAATSSTLVVKDARTGVGIRFELRPRQNSAHPRVNNSCPNKKQRKKEHGRHDPK